MSRSALSLFLALVLVAGFAAVSRADVTGSFDVHISLEPQGNQTESVPFDIDFQSNLQVNVTLSGLTFGSDIGFGVTGIEFAILSLETNLGALALTDTFVFATPFDANLVALNGGAPLFVKKRVETELNIAGITINNLGIFEDVNFTHPFSAGSTYTAADQVFVFGDVITLSGQTVSGISVTNQVGICADPQVPNVIKKRDWDESVDGTCASDIEFEGQPVSQFTVEKIWIEGIEVGGLTIDKHLEFRPGVPVSAEIDISFSVAGLANVSVSLSSTDILSLSFDSIVAVVSADNLTLILVDADADLEFDLIEAVFGVTLNPNQNPASLTVVMDVVKGAGLTFLEVVFSVSRSGLSLTADSVWSGGGPTVSFLGTTFSLSATAGALNFSADIDYGVGGLTGADITVGIDF